MHTKDAFPDIDAFGFNIGVGSLILVPFKMKKVKLFIKI